MQVPPDFYIPDFDEDERNPDERTDRKYTNPKTEKKELGAVSFINCCFCFEQNTHKTSKSNVMMNTMKETTIMIITWRTFKKKLATIAVFLY